MNRDAHIQIPLTQKELRQIQLCHAIGIPSFALVFEWVMRCTTTWGNDYSYVNDWYQEPVKGFKDQRIADLRD
jgi:hypothetical protein